MKMNLQQSYFPFMFKINNLILELPRTLDHSVLHLVSFVGFSINVSCVISWCRVRKEDG